MRFGPILLVLLLPACSPAAEDRPAAAGEKRLTFSILEDYDKGQDLEEVARDFDRVRELGVTMWRGSFGWDDYEPEPGRYDFEWLHRFAALAAERGITLRPYIGYTPSWAAAGGSDDHPWNDPPADLERWYRFARTLASEMRRHRNIVSYEIYNEENAPLWWDGTADDYRDVLRRGIDAIESGHPEAEVLLGGMVFPDDQWIEAVCEGDHAGDRVDVIPFHAYPETWTPDGVTVENYLGTEFEAGFLTAADEACGRKPIWINEIGYATTPGRSEADQARWWLRAVATYAAEPRIEHIGIYEIKDLPLGRDVIGDAPNYHLGLLRVDGGKKLAFGTLARLVSLLGDQPFVPGQPARTVTSASLADVHRHLFTRADGRRILFLWSGAGDQMVDVQVGGGAADAIEYGLDGSVGRRVPLADGWLRGLELRAGAVRLFELGR